MKKYHVYGLGNALVDGDASVDDAFLKTFNIEKNVMTLIDASAHKRLIDALKGSLIHKGCGGSAANAMIALGQFGGRGFYSCKVADDEAGRLFLHELKARQLDCNLSVEKLPPGVTGQCVVLVTEDAQRTLNTHLGISESLDIEVIDFNAIAASEYVYMEGYLITSPTARKALEAVRRHARESNTKVALSLSDPNMVKFFKTELMAIIDDQVDLLFCNEEEALLFTGAQCIEMAITSLKSLAKNLVVTCGAKGALLAIDEELFAIPTKAEIAIDTVGAGDMFAGAYLYAITQGFSPKCAVELANRAATELVCQFGARLSDQKVLSIKEEFIAKSHSSSLNEVKSNQGVLIAPH